MGGGPAFSSPGPAAPPPPPPEPVDLLILGKGWTADYLIAEIKGAGKEEDGATPSWAATTRDGRDGTIPFTFEPDDDDGEVADGKQEEGLLAPYRRLPDARAVLITFPLRGDQQPRTLIRRYEATRHDGHRRRQEDRRANRQAGGRNGGKKKGDTETRWILLGATTTWNRPALTDPSSPWDTANARARAEAALLDRLLEDCPEEAGSEKKKGGRNRGTVLCLAGLYDGASRDPARLIAGGGKFAPDKESLRGKKSVHWVHGADLGRALFVVVKGAVRVAAAAQEAGDHDGGGDENGDEEKEEEEEERRWTGLAGRRWIVSDTRCYDWWDLLSSWDAVAKEEEGREKLRMGERAATTTTAPHLPPPEYARWVGELMEEEGVAVLPRAAVTLGRVLDARDFWRAIGIWPTAGRLA